MVERTFNFLGSGEQASTGTVGGGSDAVSDALGAVTLGSDGGSSGGPGGSSDGDRDVNGDAFDPERHSGGKNSDGSWRKKRGRKAGNSASSGSRTKTNHSASVDALTQTLKVVHIAIASATKFDAMALSDDEAKTLAMSVDNVLQEFDIQPDPKVQAVVGLVIAAGSIYGPRMYLYREQVKRQKAEKKNPLNVVPIGPQGTVTQ